MKTGPKPKGRGPALARGSAIDEVVDLIKQRIAVAQEELEKRGLVLDGDRGAPVRNPADLSMRDWVAMLHKVRTPDSEPEADDEGAEPDTVAGKFHARKAAQGE